MPVTEVDAYVVNIPHAADADDAGIINPLLKRYFDHVCGIKVFGHLAVKVEPQASAPPKQSAFVSSCWSKLLHLDLSARNNMHKHSKADVYCYSPSEPALVRRSASKCGAGRAGIQVDHLGKEICNE